MILYQQGHKDIEFKLNADASIPNINVDREQIKRVVINLLDNAVHAVHEAEAPHNIDLKTELNRTMNMATLVISDTGCGIPDKDKPRLFEPYFSTKQSGTGLGLAIVATIISDHGGYIRVKDHHPRGTEIIIELPLT